MKLFKCTDHDGFWPVGVGSIILAANIKEAQRLLDGELEARGLKGSNKEPYTLTEINMKRKDAHILCDGNY